MKYYWMRHAGAKCPPGMRRARADTDIRQHKCRRNKATIDRSKQW